ncbi:MAG: hypothetical protein PWP07_151 [Epulopiscium sp.]|jgi:hypothetical protein|uniref:Uncharacterized protein n=1 Tax=Defluviitalea raffinosedens TaxID=1450156 RepID=A0A7C8LLP5_9FIRM|nr:hypothetical protein [Defluviitalea raffinosedens]MBZ4666897.1 hypothetical protein [Defluviitaleaceae bacterium]MDK2786926.1 hypothetical protein [Candidatus Epulonipiscium sp.]KAE9636119.1 hypothetical protein GND95_03050 [Defluviitalea raffinosedens]MBM7685032.1 hypothetical protein [Defluviitalea raffinosedens]HHW67504.1 hypothetical protein [Candidatus Epulonipiscium sp.]
MTVLQTIEDYIAYVNTSFIQNSQDIKCISLLYEYFRQKEPTLELEDLDQRTLDEFFLYWLPKKSKTLSDDKIYRLFPAIQRYLTYLKIKYKKEVSLFKPLDQFVEDFVRIIHLSQAFSRFVGNPVISTDPLVIDLRCYKENKIKKYTKDKSGIFEQGYFEVLDIAPDCSVTIKKKPAGRYAKVLLDENLIPYLRKGDILHLRMTRKLFFAYWEIEDIKTCYLKEAQEYLS